MTESSRNIRTIAVTTAACLVCVLFGFLMGLSVSRPHLSAKPEKGASEHVIRIADMVDASDFEAVSASIMSHPEVNHRAIQGTPLKMIMIKLVNSFREGISKHELSQLEKGTMNVSEAVFSDFTRVPEEDVARFKLALLEKLDFITPDNVSDPELNCAFGLTEDGGKSMSALVIVMSYSNLQMIRLNGPIDPSVFNILAESYKQ